LAEPNVAAVQTRSQSRAEQLC